MFPIITDLREYEAMHYQYYLLRYLRTTVFGLAKTHWTSDVAKLQDASIRCIF